MTLAFPYDIDPRGRSAEVDDDTHVRQMIEQVLLTSPGERVNRPDFGCGLLQLVFAPNADTLAAALQVTVQGSLQQWLGALLVVESVEIACTDARLDVEVRYVRRSDQRRVTAQFTQGLQ